MNRAVEIHGHCDDRFEAVRDAFAGNFTKGLELGAAVSVTLDGRSVVDLWAGSVDKEGKRSWERDTLVMIASTSKALGAACANLLIDRGQLDVDAPVARYWPEFAQGGKDRIPVRYILSHRAGLPVVVEKLTLADLYNWDRMCRVLAAQAPVLPPGEGYSYHGITYAWLVGELVRRVDGRSIGRFFREEFGEPLGIDAHIGCGPELDVRISDMHAAPPPPPGTPDVFADLAKADHDSLLYKMFFNPPLFDTVVFNSREWRAAELCASNAVTNARALARLFAALGAWTRGEKFEGKQLISQATLERARTENAAGKDAVTANEFRWGLGFMLACPARYFSDNPRAFGHTGAGGSVAFADPENRLSFGYVLNQMQSPVTGGDPRWWSLIKATYDAVGYPYSPPISDGARKITV